jgi:hypothetical protein
MEFVQLCHLAGSPLDTPWKDMKEITVTQPGQLISSTIRRLSLYTRIINVHIMPILDLLRDTLLTTTQPRPGWNTQTREQCSLEEIRRFGRDTHKRVS